MLFTADSVVGVILIPAALSAAILAKASLTFFSASTSEIGGADLTKSGIIVVSARDAFLVSSSTTVCVGSSGLSTTVVPLIGVTARRLPLAFFCVGSSACGAAGASITCGAAGTSVTCGATGTSVACGAAGTSVACGAAGASVACGAAGTSTICGADAGIIRATLTRSLIADNDSAELRIAVRSLA